MNQDNFYDFEIRKVQLESGLYIVPTPIGNVLDITLRALEVLSSVDMIACEDTRTSSKILNQYKIKNKLTSYHDFNESEKSSYLLSELQNGKSIALISDSGTPLISDPGYKLIKLLTDHQIKIVSLPGASSLLSGFVASGFPTDKFTFLGFPPAKKGRQTFLQNLINIKTTIILFESKHKLTKLLKELDLLYQDKLDICICKEISKIFESYFRGKAKELSIKFEDASLQKGEFVVILNFIN